MNTVSFFTPVSFNGNSQTFKNTLLENVDSYFDLGKLFNQKIAQVIPGVRVGRSYGCIPANSNSSILFTALKIISYATLVLPLIALAVKVILRSSTSFHYHIANNQGFIGAQPNQAPPSPPASIHGGGDDDDNNPPDFGRGNKGSPPSIAAKTVTVGSNNLLQPEKEYVMTASEISQQRLYTMPWFFHNGINNCETFSERPEYSNYFFAVQTRDFLTYALVMHRKVG